MWIVQIITHREVWYEDLCSTVTEEQLQGAPRQQLSNSSSAPAKWGEKYNYHFM